MIVMLEIQQKIIDFNAKLNNKISKFATVVSAVEPVDTAAGHVWLELV